MGKREIPVWMEKIKIELINVIPRYREDLGGPLSVLRYGKGSDLELLGTIFKFIGENEKAQKTFLEASFAYWPYESGKTEEGWQGEEGIPEFIYEKDAGNCQRKAAICSFLAGKRERARKLFVWASENLDIPKYYLDQWRPGGISETLSSGEIILRQAYVDTMLGRFNSAKEKITDAKNIFDYFAKKEKKKINMEYRYQCEIFRELTEFKLNPTCENKSKAQNTLVIYKKACPKNIQGLMNYLYIFDFQEAFPDVFVPVLP